MNLIPDDADKGALAPPANDGDYRAPLTMSSREIADLTGKEHKNVLADVRKMLSELGKAAADFSATASVPGPNGSTRTIEVFNLPKRETLILVSGYSIALRAKIIDRWQELEEAAAKPVQLSRMDILRMAIESEQRALDAEALAQERAILIEQQKPAVDFVEKYVEAKNSLGLREVVKVLGVREREFVRRLIAANVMFRQGEHLLPYAKWQAKGYFEVKTGNKNDHDWVQVKFTPAGVAWIAERLRKSAAAATATTT